MLPDKRSIRYRSIDHTRAALIGSQLDFRSISSKKRAIDVEQNVRLSCFVSATDRTGLVRYLSNINSSHYVDSIVSLIVLSACSSDVNGRKDNN